MVKIRSMSFCMISKRIPTSKQTEHYRNKYFPIGERKTSFETFSYAWDMYGIIKTLLYENKVKMIIKNKCNRKRILYASKNTLFGFF